MSLLSASMFTRIWGIRFETVVHIGAHLAEEMEEYASAGWGKSQTIWIEALPNLCEAIRQKSSRFPNHRVINAALDQTSREVDFFEATNDQASSLLLMSGHVDLYPEIKVRQKHRMTTLRFDQLGLTSFRLPAIARLDVQGAELRVLQGFGERIRDFTTIWAEYSEAELYEGSALLHELDELLSSNGFRRVITIRYHEQWGDGVWIKVDSLPKHQKPRIFASAVLVFLNKACSKLNYELRKQIKR